MQQAGCRVQGGISARERSNEHHEVHDVRREGDTQFREDQHERRLGQLRVLCGGLPGHQAQNNCHGHHVEGGQAPDHCLHAGCHRACRVLRLRCGERNHFHTAKGEHDNSHRNPDGCRAVRQEAAVVHEVCGTRRSVTGQTHEHQQDTNHHEHDDGRNLNRREQELQSAEGLHAHQIQHQNNRTEESDEHSQGNVREPVRHVVANRHQLSTSQRHGARPIRPASQIAAKGVQVSARNGAETALDGMTHGHFARARSNGCRNHRTNSVREDCARARNFNGGGGAQEQARTQRQAHCNHGQLAVGEGTIQRVVLLRLLGGVPLQFRHNVSLS